MCVQVQGWRSCVSKSMRDKEQLTWVVCTRERKEKNWENEPGSQHEPHFTDEKTLQASVGTGIQSKFFCSQSLCTLLTLCCH